MPKQGSLPDLYFDDFVGPGEGELKNCSPDDEDEPNAVTPPEVIDVLGYDPLVD